MANEAEELTGFLSCYDDEDGSEDKLLCYEFGLGKHVIGRSQETSNIVIQSSRTISEQHAEITLYQDYKLRLRCTLRDLNSKNGIFINGDHFADPTVVHELQPGDVIRFGYDKLNFTFGFDKSTAKNATVSFDGSIAPILTSKQSANSAEVENGGGEEDAEVEANKGQGSPIRHISPVRRSQPKIPRIKSIEETPGLLPDGALSPSSDHPANLRIPPTPTVKSPLSSKSSVAWVIPAGSESSLEEIVDFPAGRSSPKKPVENVEPLSIETSATQPNKTPAEVTERRENGKDTLSITLRGYEEELYLSEQHRCLSNVNNLLQRKVLQRLHQGLSAIKLHVLSCIHRKETGKRAAAQRNAPQAPRSDGVLPSDLEQPTVQPVGIQDTVESCEARSKSPQKSPNIPPIHQESAFEPFAESGDDIAAPIQEFTDTTEEGQCESRNGNTNTTDAPVVSEGSLSYSETERMFPGDNKIAGETAQESTSTKPPKQSIIHDSPFMSASSPPAPKPSRQEVDVTEASRSHLDTRSIVNAGNFEQHEPEMKGHVDGGENPSSSIAHDILLIFQETNTPAKQRVQAWFINQYEETQNEWYLAQFEALCAARKSLQAKSEVWYKRISIHPSTEDETLKFQESMKTRESASKPKGQRKTSKLSPAEHPSTNGIGESSEATIPSVVEAQDSVDLTHDGQHKKSISPVSQGNSSTGSPVPLFSYGQQDSSLTESIDIVVEVDKKRAEMDESIQVEKEILDTSSYESAIRSDIVRLAEPYPVNEVEATVASDLRNTTLKRSSASPPVALSAQANNPTSAEVTAIVSEDVNIDNPAEVYDLILSPQSETFQSAASQGGSSSTAGIGVFSRVSPSGTNLPKSPNKFARSTPVAGLEVSPQAVNSPMSALTTMTSSVQEQFITIDRATSPIGTLFSQANGPTSEHQEVTCPVLEHEPSIMVEPALSPHQTEEHVEKTVVEDIVQESESNEVVSLPPSENKSEDGLAKGIGPESLSSERRTPEDKPDNRDHVSSLGLPAFVDTFLKAQLLKQLKETSKLLSAVKSENTHAKDDTVNKRCTAQEMPNETPSATRKSEAPKVLHKGANNKKVSKSVFGSHAAFLRLVLTLLKARRQQKAAKELSKVQLAREASLERTRIVQFMRSMQRYNSLGQPTIEDFRIAGFRMQGIGRIISEFSPLEDTLCVATFFAAWQSHYFSMHPPKDEKRLTPALDSCIRLVLQAKLLGHGPGSQKRRKRSSVLLDRMIDSRLASNVDLRKMKAFLQWKHTYLYLEKRDSAAALCLAKLDSINVSPDTFKKRRAAYIWRRQYKIVTVLTKYVVRYYENGWVYGFYVLKWNWQRFKTYRLCLLRRVVFRTYHRLLKRGNSAFKQHALVDEVKAKCLETARLAVAYKRRGRYISQVFRSWSAYVVSAKENEAAARTFYVTKVLGRSLKRWKLNAKFVKLTKRSHQRRKKGLFDKWVAKLEVWRLMANWRVFALKVKKKQYMRTRRKIISVVNARRCSAIKLRSFVKENRRIKLLQYFTLWKDGARSWKFMFLRYTTGKDRQLLRRTFSAWRYYFKVEVPKIQRRIKLAKFRILRYSVKMWRMWLAERRDKKRRSHSMLKSFVLRKMKKLLRLHYGLWKRQWFLFSALNLVSKIFLKFERKSKHRAVQHWSRATALAKHKHLLDQMNSIVERFNAVQGTLEELKRQQAEREEAKEEDMKESLHEDDEFGEGDGDEQFFEGGDENMPSENTRNGSKEDGGDASRSTDIVAMEKTSTILKRLNEFDALEKTLLKERKAAQKEIEGWSRRVARHGKEKQILEEEVIRIQRTAAQEKRELETTIRLYEKRLYKLNKTISEAAKFESPIESQHALALIHGQIGAAIKAEARARSKYEQLCTAMKTIKNSKRAKMQERGLSRTTDMSKPKQKLSSTVSSQPVGSGVEAARNIRETR